MGISTFTGFFAFLLLRGVVFARRNSATSTTDISFDQNYYITWGNDHVLSLNQGRELQLSMDTSSG